MTSCSSTSGARAARTRWCAPPAESVEDIGAIARACLASIDGDPTQYGTAAAADDLEAVRVALGHRRLNVYGTSYGATLAQVYLARHPRSVGTLVLDGGTLLDIPFFGRFAAGTGAAGARPRRPPLRGRRALRADVPGLARSARRADRDLEPTTRPRHARRHADRRRARRRRPVDDARRVAGRADPAVVSGPAAGDLTPLTGQLPADSIAPVTFWSIWCNERWVGLDSTGRPRDVPRRLRRRPDRFLQLGLRARPRPQRAGVEPPPRALPGAGARARRRCRPARPRREPRRAGRGDAEQPHRRRPGQGHAIGQYGCLPDLVARVVERGSVSSLHTRCVSRIETPPSCCAEPRAAD